MLIQCCCATCGLLLDAVLAGVVMPKRLLTDPSSGRYYLDSAGVGAATWAWLIFVKSCCILVSVGAECDNDKVNPHNSEREKAASLSKQLASLDTSGATCVLGSLSLRYRSAKVMLLFARALINISFIIFSFITLPKRDPNERLNMAKHIVSWVELPLIIIMCLTFCCSSVLSVLSGNAEVVYFTAKLLRSIGKVSVLMTVPLVHPVAALEQLMTSWNKRGKRGIVLVVFRMIFLVPTAVLCLLVKIEQVEFVAEDFYYGWSLSDYIKLAGFINHLVAVIPDADDIKMETILSCSIVKNGSDPNPAYNIAELWRQDFIRKVVRQLGVRISFLSSATLVSTDLMVLLHDPKNVPGKEQRSLGTTAAPDSHLELDRRQKSNVFSVCSGHSEGGQSVTQFGATLSP